MPQRSICLTFRKSNFASGSFEGQDFSTWIRKHISLLRAVFPVVDGVRLALEISENCLGSERSLQGKRKDGRIGHRVRAESRGVLLWSVGGFPEEESEGV